MHNVVIDKPYVFVPPYEGRWWPRFLQIFVRRRLRRLFGIQHVECRGLERIRASRAAGHGMLWTPNHCRPPDPFVISEVARQVGELPFTLASWHLFMQGKLQAWMLRHAGVFSIYREGMDRAALAAATEILTKAERPLVIFPEGVITRTNDRLNALMEGTALIARSAAKKRAAENPPRQVVVHPIAMRYLYDGPIEEAIAPVLDEIENRLTWQPTRKLSTFDRIAKVGNSLLALKELEYLDATQSGTIYERVDKLINHLLVPLEQQFTGGKSDGPVVSRVKRLRTAMVPELIQGELTEQQRDQRWKQMADLYLAQQLSFYPPDYIQSDAHPQRMLETVERFEEDLTDKCRRYSPMRVIVEVGEAIPVSAARERGAAEDPLMAGIETQLNQMLSRLT